MSLSVVVVLEDRDRLHALRDRLLALQPPLTRVLAIGSGDATMSQV
jgi:hypothetical protein